VIFKAYYKFFGLVSLTCINSEFVSQIICYTFGRAPWSEGRPIAWSSCSQHIKVMNECNRKLYNEYQQNQNSIYTSLSSNNLHTINLNLPGWISNSVCLLCAIERSRRCILLQDYFYFSIRVQKCIPFREFEGLRNHPLRISQVLDSRDLYRKQKTMWATQVGVGVSGIHSQWQCISTEHDRHEENNVSCHTHRSLCFRQFYGK
jgi:hypothetical protein